MWLAWLNCLYKGISENKGTMKLCVEWLLIWYREGEHSSAFHQTNLQPGDVDYGKEWSRSSGFQSHCGSFMDVTNMAHKRTFMVVFPVFLAFQFLNKSQYSGLCTRSHKTHIMSSGIIGHVHQYNPCINTIQGYLLYSHSSFHNLFLQNDILWCQPGSVSPCLSHHEQ